MRSAGFCAERLERLVVVLGREHDLDEVLGDRPPSCRVDRAVQHQDAAEGRDRVGGEGARVGVLDLGRDRDARRGSRA